MQNQMGEEVCAVGELVKNCRDALAANDEESALGALKAILGVLQEGQLAVRTAQLPLAVRTEILGSTAEEWLTRLLLRAAPAVAELAEQIIDAMEGASVATCATADGNDVEAIPFSFGGRTLHLVPAHSNNPDWTMSDGSVVWAGGRVLARMVFAGDVDVEGKRLLELGCGLGAVGIACAQMGAKEAFLTDLDADLLRAVVCSAQRNGVSDVVRSFPLDWTDIFKAADLRELFDQHNISPKRPLDMILGADVIYEEGHAPVFRDVIHRMLREGFTNEVVLAIVAPEFREGPGAFASLLGVRRDQLLDVGGCDAGEILAEGAGQSHLVQWTVTTVLGVKPGRNTWVYHFRSALQTEAHSTSA